jgi:hypothetical protein
MDAGFTNTEARLMPVEQAERYLEAITELKYGKPRGGKLLKSGNK